MRFARLAASELSSLTLEGVALSTLSGEQLARLAAAACLPRSLSSDESQLRLLLGALVRAHGDAVALPHEALLDVREEARGLLLLAIRREGCVTTATADALNVLNQQAVVEKYTARGNKWTMSDASRDAPSVVERVRKELGAESAMSTKEWLTSLADALEAPPNERAWYTSKMVWFVLMLAFLFVGVHVLLLARVLMKVHSADANVLLYPLYGLSAAGTVGAFAIGVHKLSEPAPKQAKD